MPKKTITYTYRGMTERWSKSKRSYQWKEGYSATSYNGAVQYPWLTKKECQSDAKSQGYSAVFYVCPVFGKSV